MLQKNPEYRRLKVEGYGALGSASYWLGGDHLLVVASSNYVENYYRFGYADIQALIIRRNALRLLWGLVFSVLTVSSLLSAWAVKASTPGSSPEAIYGMGALLAVALAFAALQTLNLLRGPTCICHVRTAVQTVPLPHLTRWRRAELLVKELTPLALSAQAQATAATPAGETVAGVSLPEPPADGATGTAEAGPEDPNLPPRISS